MESFRNGNYLIGFIQLHVDITNEIFDTFFDFEVWDNGELTKGQWVAKSHSNMG